MQQKAGKNGLNGGANEKLVEETQQVQMTVQEALEYTNWAARIEGMQKGLQIALDMRKEQIFGRKINPSG